jgi:hypothetical protein
VQTCCICSFAGRRQKTYRRSAATTAGTIRTRARDKGS